MESPKVGPSRGNAGKGRRKGVPNKTTTALKDMILQAVDKAGGVDYLVAQSRDNPSAFLTLAGKVLPLQVNANVNVLTDEDRRWLGD